MRHDLAQMLAAAFVAQPAGDADVVIRIEIFETFFLAAGKTMHDGLVQAAVEILHHRHEIFVRIALVDTLANCVEAAGRIERFLTS